MQLLTEILRPKTYNQAVLLNRVKKSLNIDDLSNGIISQNMLFHSKSGGLGKTSICQIIENQYYSTHIDVSIDRGIDIARSLEDFCLLSPLQDMDNRNYNFKVVVFEEMDNATDALYKALRIVIEKYSNTCRFIGNCNFIEKIPIQIQSRFNVINFEPENIEEEKELTKKIIERIKIVSKKLNISFENDECLHKFVQTHFPDMRKMFSKLQDFKTSGVKVITNKEANELEKDVEMLKPVLELILSNSNDTPEMIYKFIYENYEGVTERLFESLLKNFIPLIYSNNSKEYLRLQNNASACYIVISDWCSKRKDIVNPNSAIIAALNQMNLILKNS